MPQDLLPKNKFGYAVAAVCVVLMWGTIKVLEMKSAQQAREFALQKATKDSLNDGKIVVRAPTEDPNSYDYLLIESILTIVQNYYVDHERASNANLLALALRRLEETGEITYRKSGDAIDIERNKRVLRIDRTKQLDLPAFVTAAAGISELLLDPDLEHTDQASNWLHEGRFKFIDSMLSALDPHSTLLDSFAYRELRQGTEGAFGGLGVVVGVKKDLLTVIKPIPRSPAARAGILKDDKIIKINETSTFGATLDSLVEHMRGAPGTAVKLSLMREGSYSPAELSIKREIIQVDSVTSTLLKKGDMNVLHVAIESFSSRTSAEVKDSIDRHPRQAKIAGVVLDLRGNPGGLLDQAVQVSDLFLSRGKIVSTKGRRSETESAEYQMGDFTLPLVVLINADSASASEIVAGALQDNERAVVIGQPSFGKGSVQTIFELPGEQALKLTIARYYTPSEVSIQNIGIRPDIWVQPVLRNQTNQNLFGAYRYRSEKFLRNSLDSKGVQGANEDTRDHHMSYYLVDKISDSPDEDALESDYEVTLALSLLQDLAKAEPGRSTAEYLRESAAFVEQLTQPKDAEVIAWLQQHFGLNWEPSGLGLGHHQKIAVTQKVQPVLEIGKDSEIKLEWAITNQEKTPIGRVSVFVQVGVDVLTSFEFLVGKVDAGATVKATGSIPFLASKEQKVIKLKYGLSVDGLPIYTSDVQQIVKVIDGPMPEITASAELVHEVGGTIPGVLEANERGYLKVKIENLGNRDAENITLELLNLSGAQVSLSKLLEQSSKLEAGEEREFLFPLVAAARIKSQHVGFGLTVSGSNMGRALKKRVEVPGHAEREAAAAPSGTIAH